MGGEQIRAGHRAEFIVPNAVHAAFAHGHTHQTRTARVLSGYGLSFLGDVDVPRADCFGMADQRD